MSMGKVILIGVAGLAAVAVVAAVASAKPKSSSSGVPSGWVPPANAVRGTFPTSILNKPISIAVWPADPGQPAGKFQLFWSPKDSQTFLALFWPQGQPAPAVMGVGSTPESITLQQAIPELVQQANAAGLTGAAA